MSVDLKRRGFKFVGSTICYAYMQAAGMVNDHVVAGYGRGEFFGEMALIDHLPRSATVVALSSSACRRATLARWERSRLSMSTTPGLMAAAV